MTDAFIAARLREYAGPTIFSEMTALAQETGAANLGQGFPDSDGPPELLDAARDAIARGMNQYPPAIGLPALRGAIAARRADDHGVSYDPDHEIVVTAGATEAIAAALIGLCDPGDEVIVFDPLYDSYSACLAMAQVRRVPVLLEYDGTRFAFDPDALRRAVGPRTKVLLLNTPHNPTGKVFDEAELELIARLCVEHDLIAVTDEVYEYLVYDRVRHLSLAALPGMRERVLSISSAGKTFSSTGWKVGWACGPARLVGTVRTVKQYLTFGTGTPLQAAVAVALTDCMPWVEELRASLERRRDLLVAGLRAGGITTYPSHGTYFVQMDARSFGSEDGQALCRALVTEAGVAAIPSVALYDDKAAGRHLVRLAFCKDEDLLSRAARRLAGHARAARPL
ncbi:pyridoxal phosphate-dependent aminotransferase [Streptomyces roseirectus]|uniref:Pyridoxal phosphate-dependent aminotransferase n=1 Tax=Streptomyces roseirectus TaxID=2768066 RepID=A0A7H0I6B9_9ACTN|nr:pyridoxal phosphate-dependent aminotransferase [Streptomyces roseirectus]QNP68335.1 pyridoxal phosphate-dependent aminotransferase [Streptomyces roseirectus]